MKKMLGIFSNVADLEEKEDKKDHNELVRY